MRNCSTTVCGCPLAIGSAGKICSLSAIVQVWISHYTIQGFISGKWAKGGGKFYEVRNAYTHSFHRSVHVHFAITTENG